MTQTLLPGFKPTAIDREAQQKVITAIMRRSIPRLSNKVRKNPKLIGAVNAYIWKEYKLNGKVTRDAVLAYGRKL